jgi:lysophospholipase L1-like esterase
MKTASLQKNIIFAFLASSIGLVLLVFFIEAFYWTLNWYKGFKSPEMLMGTDATEFDSKLGWTPIKNANYIYDGLKISINSVGLRSSEVNPSKEHVLVVGDSVTFGVGVSNDETFPYFLGRRIEKKYRNIQVLNLGVPGYGLDQYYLRLKRYIVDLKPKIIIVLICSRNDLADSSSENPYGKKKPFFIIEDGVLKQTTKDISFLNCQNIFSKSWLLRKPFFASFRTPLCQTKSRSRKETIKVVKALIEEIKGLAHEYEAKILFATIPQRDVFLLNYCISRPDLNFCKKRKQDLKRDLLEMVKKTKETNPDKYAKIVAGLYGGYNRGQFDFRELQNLLRATQSNRLDVNFKFLESGLPIEDFNGLFVDEVHFSAKGNSILSQFFEEYLEVNHWLEPEV